MDNQKNHDIVQGYEVKKSILFDNNRGFALAENQSAMQPYVTWMFTENENGKRDYEWGHYTSDKEKALADFAARISEYQKDYGVSIKTAGMKYYEIDEAAARRAKEANSFRDYVPGSATAEYRAMADAAYALGERQKRCVDPMYHEKIDRLLDTYARKLADNLNERNAIDARVPSIMIAGGSNFPVRKKEKQNAARDRNMGEYMEIKGLLDRIGSTGRGGISADDIHAEQKLEAKLESLMAAQEHMKAVNAYYRKHKVLDGCPDLSKDMLRELKTSMARDWRKNPMPFPAYALSNNNQNIHRVRQRIEDLDRNPNLPGGLSRVAGPRPMKRKTVCSCSLTKSPPLSSDRL